MAEVNTPRSRWLLDKRHIILVCPISFWVRNDARIASVSRMSSLHGHGAVSSTIREVRQDPASQRLGMAENDDGKPWP